MTDYDKWLKAVWKWECFRMRMIERCVKHGVDAYIYRNAIATDKGLILCWRKN